MPGPLVGIRILEMAGLGPTPFCGMMLADHGAEVIRVEREGGWRLPGDPLLRSRRTMRIDLDRKSTRLNSSHVSESRMPSSA